MAEDATNESVPRWREDFPIEWESDHYVTRREMTKFLALGSGLLAGMSVILAAAGRFFRPPVGPGARVRVARASAIAAGGSLLFRYPADDDPCILVRAADGTLRAYSQVCTHLSCAVVHRPTQDALFCPCHHGWFAASDGRPTGGPPSRRLPRVTLEVRGDEVFATGLEV